MPDDFELELDSLIGAEVEKNPKRRITVEENRFILTFPFDIALNDAVKVTLPGCRFAKKTKQWTAPVTFEATNKIHRLVERFGFTLDRIAMETIEEIGKLAEKNLAESQAPAADIDIPGIAKELRQFQKAGIQYASRVKRTFIADEMGLGKTIEALGTLEAMSAYPAIVVCPASVKLNWAREAKSWLPGRSTVIIHNSVDPWWRGAHITIINYDLLKRHADALKNMKARAIVFDESHYCKASNTQRTRFAQEIVDGLEQGQGIEYRLNLTGTPILNRPNELLSQLKLLGRLDDLGGYWFFIHRYCQAEKNRYGLNTSGASNLTELSTRLRSCCMIRRTKDEVLPELPSKQLARISLAMDNESEYRAAEKDVIQWLLEHEGADKADAAARAEQLVRIEKLKQLAAHGKLAAAKEWIENFLDCGYKLVVFASHVDVQESLNLHFKGSARILGTEDLPARQKNVDRFQTDPKCQLIVCSLAAGGVGITLTAASNVAFLELGWNPGQMDQATDRLHRIGQTESVTAWYLLADGTIDDDIYELIEAKRAIVTGATGAGDVSVLNDLVQRMRGKKKNERE